MTLKTQKLSQELLADL